MSRVKGSRLLLRLAVGIATLALALGGAASAGSVTPRRGDALVGFDNGLIAAFKARVQASPDVAAAWAANRAAADRLLEAPVDRISLNPRASARTVEPLILAWRMT